MWKQVALALALFTLAGGESVAQVQRSVAPSTGRDMRPDAQALIDAVSGQAIFEAVSDTRFRVVRHRASGFVCTFMPGSDASLQVIDAASADAACSESQHGAVNMGFRIMRKPGAAIGTLFDRTVAALRADPAWTSPLTDQRDGAFLNASPAPPHAPLSYERRAVLVSGTRAEGSRLFRLSIAKLPGDWFVQQQYVAALPRSGEPQQVATWAQQGVQVAEAVFAARLGELTTPATRDAALR